MTLTKNLILKSSLAAVLAGAALSASAVPAAADIACNRWGDCWHVGQRYTTYPPALGVVFHDDDWRAHHWNHRYHWYDRDEDHGYYDHGVWHPF